MARLTVWSPFNEMMTVNQMLRNQMRASGTVSNFPVDLSENNEGYMLQGFVPGVRPEDLHIDFADSTLTIKAETKAPTPTEGVTYHLRERAFGRYERSMRFPVHIDVENIKATFENGELILFLPKAEASKPRRIEVQVPVNSIESGE